MFKAFTNPSQGYRLDTLVVKRGSSFPTLGWLEKRLSQVQYSQPMMLINQV